MIWTKVLNSQSKIPGSAPGENAQDGTNDSAVWNFPPQDECDEQYSSTFFPEFVSVIYFGSFLDYCSHIHLIKRRLNKDLVTGC